jgi:hypothetical protein
MSKVKSSTRNEYSQVSVGTRFGALVVVAGPVMIGPKNRTQAWWECLCDCGVKKRIRAMSLKCGRSRSCGCMSNQYRSQAITTHGLRGTSEYKSWGAMIARCYNPNEPGYLNYGGRGIGVCDRWRQSFESFYADMGPKPTVAYQIDRIDNNGNYEPRNCRWATRRQQNRNKRTNHLLTYRGVTRTVTDWADALGMKPSTLRCRLRYGWTVAEAIEIGLCPRGHKMSGDTPGEAVCRAVKATDKGG